MPLSYLLWKPVAVGLLFFGALRYVRRLLPAGGAPCRADPRPVRGHARQRARRLDGWGGNPRQYTFDFISGEMWSGQYLWGYLMTAIAVALMPLVLLGVERLAQERPAGARLAAAARC